MRFFFDTADISYLENLWSKLEGKIQNNDVAGITTNPNAFNKINANSLIEWQQNTLKLCKLVSSIRNDNKGVVYVQVPNSNMKKNEVVDWANRIIDWSDG